MSNLQVALASQGGVDRYKMTVIMIPADTIRSCFVFLQENLKFAALDRADSMHAQQQ